MVLYGAIGINNVSQITIDICCEQIVSLRSLLLSRRTFLASRYYRLQQWVAGSRYLHCSNRTASLLTFFLHSLTYLVFINLGIFMPVFSLEKNFS